MRSGFAFRDGVTAIAVALIVAVLFCLRQSMVAGDIRQAFSLAFFVLPIACLVTIFVEMPLLFFMKTRGRNNLLGYVMVPGVTVLILYMAPLLLNPGIFSVLNFEGRALLRNGSVVWHNIGWMIVYHVEPALWAALAGFIFWWLRIKSDYHEGKIQ
jgi:hypothetical protein